MLLIMVAHNTHVTCHTKQCFFFLGRRGALSLATSEKAREGANVKNGPNSPHYEEQKSKVTIFREELPTRRIP